MPTDKRKITLKIYFIKVQLKIIYIVNFINQNLVFLYIRNYFY